MGQIQGLVGRDGAEAVQAMIEGARRLVQHPRHRDRQHHRLPWRHGRVHRAADRAQHDLAGQAQARHRVMQLPARAADLVRAGGGRRFLLLVSLLVSAALSAIALPGATSSHADHAVAGRQRPGLAGRGHPAVRDGLQGAARRRAPLARRLGRLAGDGGLLQHRQAAHRAVPGNSTVASSYGAAGSVVVLLVWVYYSSQVVLLGAEFTRYYVEYYRGKPPPREAREAGPGAARRWTRQGGARGAGGRRDGSVKAGGSFGRSRGPGVGPARPASNPGWAGPARERGRPGRADPSSATPSLPSCRLLTLLPHALTPSRPHAPPPLPVRPPHQRRPLRGS